MEDRTREEELEQEVARLRHLLAGMSEVFGEPPRLVAVRVEDADEFSPTMQARHRGGHVRVSVSTMVSRDILLHGKMGPAGRTMLASFSGHIGREIAFSLAEHVCGERGILPPWDPGQVGPMDDLLRKISRESSEFKDCSPRTQFIEEALALFRSWGMCFRLYGSNVQIEVFNEAEERSIRGLG